MGIVICRKVANIRCEKVLYCMSLDNISLQLEQNHLLAVLVGTWTLSLKFKGRQTPPPQINHLDALVHDIHCKVV